MNNSTSKTKFPLAFFVLTFIISVPFWLIAALTEQFLPKEMPVNPIGILISDSVKKLLKKSFDYKRIKGKIWYVPIFFLMPVIMILAYGLMNLMGVSIPGLPFPVVMAPIFFLVYFIFALGEEVGWMGYAVEPMQDRWNALKASIMFFIQMHQPAIWIVGQCINLAVTRILIVWIYNNTGKSVFAAILFHAMYNVGTFLFPNYGSIYGPFIACIVVTVTVVIVTFLWGPKTLAQFRKK